LAAADQSLGFDWATWCTPVVRWIGLALNVLMLIATPIRGDHYLVDVLSGLAVAAAAVAATAWMFGRIPQGRQPALAAAASPI
jgi:membrane-associated phospholipid phosphatase